MAMDKKGLPPNPSPLERAAARFVKTWSLWEHAFGRASSALASRMRFSFFLTMTVVALAFLFWDYHGIGAWAGDTFKGGNRNLSSVEDSLFDWVIAKRPIDPKSSGNVVIAEIDQCSIDYFEKKGLPGWPWPRDRHADLLTALGDAGVAVVGYDVLFLDKQSGQADSDDMLLQVAKLGAPAFFGANYGAPAADTPSTNTANRWPTALPLVARPTDTPVIGMDLPFGQAMREHSGFVNIQRSGDGVMRDFDLWYKAGDWGVPSMAALVAAQYLHRKFTSFPKSIRLNWRSKHPLPVVSAVDLLPDEHMPCVAKGQKLPDLKGRIVLVGYVAAGINDAKPTPIDPQMAGVVLQGEAVENLVGDSYIRMPADGFKYALAALLILVIGFSFWRGEPSQDIDAVFTATNLLLTAVAVLTLTFTTFFFDIFTSIATSLTFFGLCRTYLAGMRGRALGNDDHVPELGEHGRLHVVLLLLRVSVAHEVAREGHNSKARQFWETNEYRRRIRRILYAHGYAKIHEGLIERKTFLAADFRDVILMICDAPTVEELRWEILHDLKLINHELAKIADEIRIDQIATASAVYVDLSGLDEQTRAMSLQNTLGKV
ncbi:MAG TPA: CHASE2 domain-containing protein, partial [Xanthomonadaceae bacterium]|nr:CHASE2 domain-containing protein [Xanthomonadaceae bacterium]